MKKILIIAAIAGCISFSVQAQTMPERENTGVQNQRTTQKRAEMYKDLNLTEQQKQKLTALNKDGREAMQAIKNDSKLTQEQKRTQSNELIASQKIKRDAILTADQRTKLDEKLQQMQASNKGKRNGKNDSDNMKKDDRKKKNGDADKSLGSGRDKNGLSKADNRRRGNGNWINSLNLNEEQKKQMKILNEETRSEIQIVRDNISLTNDQKKTRIEEIMKATKTKRKSILTPEQEAAWEMKQQQMRSGWRQQGRRGVNI
ncbi:MAG: hypothetical protein ACK5NK_10210 [Niabella sp.]